MKRYHSFNNKVILIISPEFWGNSYVSKHHFARELSTANKVYFLNPPSDNFEVKPVGLNLYIVDYKSRLRGLRKLPMFISGYVIRREVTSLEKKTGTVFDIIWNFDSSRFFNLSLLKEKLRIAHIVDWSENFNRDLLCRTSDICLCTSEILKADMIRHNIFTFNIGHGFNKDYKELNPDELEDISGDFLVKAGYVGNLSLKYIDWDLFYTLMVKNPNVGFYLIGPEGKSNLTRKFEENPYLKKIKGLKNVILLGEKSANKIPSFLKLVDVLILLYKADVYRNQLANPHKILEYLGSGKVIVASWTDEYKDKPELIEMTENREDIIELFEKVVNNLSYFNSPEKQEKRKSYAIKNNYENKVRAIEKLINDKIAKNY